MTPIIALAGLADAGIYYSFVMWRVLTVAAIAMAIWAAVRPTKGRLWVSAVSMFSLVVLLQPWSYFLPQPPSVDPDVEYWQGKWRLFSAMLVGSAAFSAALTIAGARRLKRKKEPKQTPEPMPLKQHGSS